MKLPVIALLAVLLVCELADAQLPDGYWPVERSQPNLDATLRVQLDPDVGHLSTAE